MKKNERENGMKNVKRFPHIHSMHNSHIIHTKEGNENVGVSGG